VSPKRSKAPSPRTRLVPPLEPKIDCRLCRISVREDRKGVVVNAKVFHRRLEQVTREYALICKYAQI
jgi:hypothetical protein